jgi:hypothetical protein
MPEASMNEKNGSTPWKDDVRSSGQPLIVEDKAQTTSMQKATNDKLRLRVPLLDGSHHVASLFPLDVPDHYPLVPWESCGGAAAMAAHPGATELQPPPTPPPLHMERGEAVTAAR